MQFRYQLLIALARKVEDSNCLSYTPHLWQILIDKEQELHFEESFLKYINTSFVVSGNRTYLDQFIHSVLKDSFENKHYYMCFPEERIDNEEYKSVDVIGDYIVTTKFNKDIGQKIQKLFSETKPLEDIDSLNILPICNRGSKIKITLVKNKQKANIYKKRFTRLFGPLDRW